MKILITGARGLLGSNLALLYSKNHEVIATGVNKPDFSFCKNYELDITKEGDMNLIRKERPDLLVNCAALTNVDFCEDHPDIARKLNVDGVRNLAKICKENSVYLIHISTDAVFDGKKGNYSENDAPNPINVYGKTKLEAEEAIKKIGGKYSIIRTNIYGWNHEEKFSLAEWMLDKLEKKEQFNAFTDITFTPILTTNLGEALIEVYRNKITGLINIAGSESCSKYHFAKKVASVFKEEESLIKSSSSDDFSFKAKRAKNMSLNTDKARNLLKTKLLNVEDGLKEFKSLRENGFLEKLKCRN